MRLIDVDSFISKLPLYKTMSMCLSIEEARGFNNCLKKVYELIEQQTEVETSKWILCDNKLPVSYGWFLVWYEYIIDGGTCDGERCEWYGIAEFDRGEFLVESKRKVAQVIAWTELIDEYEVNYVEN